MEAAEWYAYFLAFSAPPPQNHTLPYNLGYETHVTSPSPNPRPPNEALRFRPSSCLSPVSASTIPLNDDLLLCATTPALAQALTDRSSAVLVEAIRHPHTHSSQPT